ncbi:hypothetical protein [Nostoc sp. MG11]|uniref:hypothetical protein n=1 Tax=Nostoc sp. MG11 TaxID=2721166 RepID=UPI0018684D90|nr:hypothetical protein [Nostoc sp. MG11]
MFLKRFSGVVAVIALSVSGTAIAQTTNNYIYIEVGADSHGNPITLDLSSIKGTEYILLHKHNAQTVKTTLYASCSEGRLFSKRISLYTLTGRLTSDNKTEREIFLKPGTADAGSMEIVCQAAGIHKDYSTQSQKF